MTDSQTVDFLELDEATERSSGGALIPSVSQYLVFSVSKLEMAIGLAQVSEIVPYERVSSLPGMPSYIRGVTQVRGRWTPVIDLSLKFGLPLASITKRSCILVLELRLEHESLPVGIVLDGVATLLDLDAAHISPPPRFGVGVDVRYMQGLVATDRGSLPLIDFTQVFAGSDLEQIAAGAQQANNQASLTSGT